MSLHVSRVLPHAGLTPPAPARATSPSTTSFAAVFERELEREAPVRFSAHATERLAQRAIRLTPAQEACLGWLLDLAAAKGARESLLLMDHVAFVVNVSKRTVITAAPLTDTEELVFTNIDSVVVAPEHGTPPQEALETGPAPYWGSPRAAER